MSFEWVTQIVPAAEMTEGPYYGRASPFRSDIRENVKGTDFELVIKVVDATSGLPLAGYIVDLWHCDARGNYSGYEFDPDAQPESVEYQMPTNKDTFLRGSQVTNSKGMVRFLTIFPGWYATRTTHMHLKVFQASTCILTSQLYVPEVFANSIYSEDNSYFRTVERDTFNQNDIVLARTAQSIDGCWVELRREDGKIHGESLLAVDPDARSVRRDVPPGFRPPLGGVPHEKKVR